MTDTSSSITRRGYTFAQLPEWVLLHPDLTDKAKLLFALLDRHAGADGDCFPSKRRLAEMLGCDTRTIIRAKDLLEQVGALEVQPRYDDGRQTSNLYILNGLPPEEPRHHVDGGGVISVTPPVTSVSPPGVSSVSPHEREPEDREPVKETRARSEHPTFEIWYQAYPRKVGRKRAAKAYNEALRHAEPETLLSAAVELRKRAETMDDEDKRFIPHPTTWLNQGRWDDDLDDVYPEETKKGFSSERNRKAIREGLGL